MRDVQTVDGTGPIDARTGGALDVNISFFVPTTNAVASFEATAVVLAEGTTGPPLMQFSISATVDLLGGIEIIASPVDRHDE
jgi:hypothetical protein